MEDFKKLPKMQCFKTGGVVNTMKTGGKPKAMCYGGKMKEGGKADIAQDKKMIKKAIAMHDKQEHPGEKTDLSKLKKGGRSKKAVGTVRKYKTGGAVIDTKPGKEDPLKKVKPAAKKAAAPSKAAMLPAAKGTVDAFKKGGKVKKFSDGSSTGPLSAEEEAWLGGADRNDPIIMARMRSALGSKKTAPSVAAAPSAAVAPTDSTLRDETGAPSTMQRNEYGDLYTPISQMAPTTPVKPAVRRAAKPVAAAPVDTTMRDETGAPSTMQRNEYGDLYTPIGAAPVKTKRNVRSGLNIPKLALPAFSMDRFNRPAVGTSTGTAVYKKGGKVKKMAEGKQPAPMPQGAVSETEKLRLENRAKNRALLGPAQQRELDAQEAAAAKSAPVVRKKGGKACK